MAWTSPRTWVAAEVVTAALLNTHLRDNLKAIGDPGTAWTPTFSGGISAIGNATVVAKWNSAGKYTVGEFKVTMGSSTTFAAGNIGMTQPTAAALTPNLAVGVVAMYDSSAGLFYTGVILNGFAFIYNGSAGVSNTVPFTWAVNDILSGTFRYEAA